MDTDRLWRLAAAPALAAAIMSGGCLAAGCGTGGGVGAAATGAASNLASRGASFSPDVTSSPGKSFSPGGRAGAGSAAATPPSAPDTSAPDTSAPATSEPPTSAAATSAPATSAPPTSTAATPASSPAPAGGSSPPASVWLWVAVGAVALAGLTAWLIYASRHSARRREWRAQTVDAYAKGSALADAIRIAEWPAAAATDGRARWADIQWRMDELAQALYGLRVSAPGAAERAQVEDVLAGLQALHSEMAADRARSADRARNPAGPREARSREQARLAERLQVFGDQLRDLRDGNRPY